MVMKPIFTNEHLAKLIDGCIEDLEDGGSKLFDLAQLFNCIAEATGNLVYNAFVPLLGSFGGEIVTSRPFVTLPILPEPTRKKFQVVFNEAVSGCKEALKILKTELCEKESMDPNHVLKALSILGKHDYNLTVIRTTLIKSPAMGRLEE